jgi:hypothetical protein
MKRLAFVCVTLLSLTACQETRDFMGLTNVPPDEFAVVDNPPLSIPPDFNLRPPRPGAQSKQANNPSETAAKALYGDGQMEVVQQQGARTLSVPSLSPAEQALITGSGSDKADPNIRTAIDREASQQVVADRKLIDHVLFWKDTKKQNGVVVDPAAEQARLKQAASQGAPVTAGETPAIDEKSKPVNVP